MRNEGMTPFPVAPPPKTAQRRESGWDRELLAALLKDLQAIHADLLGLESEFEQRLAAYAGNHSSARNLIHYLALRRHDIRQLQEQLAALGLSSLGRMESHVLAGMEAVLKVLHQLAQREWPAATGHSRGIDFAEGKALLRANTDALLGPPPPKRSVRIMVTMPSEAAHDFQLVRQLVAGGMDCMRINCAHDDIDAWTGMVANLRRAEQELGRACRVEMDLTGPKLRTGSIDPASQIVKWRPQRDLDGHVTAPAHVWLTPMESPEPPHGVVGACLCVPAALLAGARKGDCIKFKDLRGKNRILEIGGAHAQSRSATSAQTAYLSARSAVDFTYIPKAAGAAKVSAQATVAPPSPDQVFIVVKPGDTLVVTRAPTPGRPALRDEQGRVVRPATIPCTLPEVFADVRPKEPIWFDDGKIGGVIESVDTDELRVRITVAKPDGDKLRADKGINLPDSDVHLPALTEKDIADLAFVVKHADLVGLSFIRRPEDVGALQAELRRLGAPDMGIVLKIETRTAFEQLPLILLEAMGGHSVGVMIARGDLAVECGWERLAEVQEEMLWVCEAAHVPVIWATQVLENLAKKGVPSRAEITDAAMGERAECVMLNKGPHLVDAVRVLDDILCRMEAHQSKKSARLRRLRLSAMISRGGAERQ
ncbi:MAG TPA: pyruvate kinase [Candidatus Margulisiibacteriota bacterium]|nr:pyruvate kinase [Candidatus Margulisiibacteriota bacterium]